MRVIGTSKIAGAGIALILLAVIASAQSGRKLPSVGQQKQDDTIRLRTEEVLLNITVMDDFGRQATHLQKGDFIIAEDGQKQDITSFQLASVPVNVVLMLDASGSVAGQVAALRDAAMKFVEQLGPEDQVSVIGFHTNVELLQDWTSNTADLRHAISWRFKPGMVRTKEGHADYGMTSLYDALYLVADEQLAKVEGRKALIILTDGDDTSSKVTYQQALASVVKSNSVVYVVSKARALIGDLERNYGGKLNQVLGGGTAQQASYVIGRLKSAERVMTELSKHTGGQIYSPLKDDELKDVYAQVARELKNQYILTYTSKNEERDGKLRRIQVYLTRPGYTARTRDSYYAPKT